MMCVQISDKKVLNLITRHKCIVTSWGQSFSRSRLLVSEIYKVGKKIIF